MTTLDLVIRKGLQEVLTAEMRLDQQDVSRMQICIQPPKQRQEQGHRPPAQMSLTGLTTTKRA